MLMRLILPNSPINWLFLTIRSRGNTWLFYILKGKKLSKLHEIVVKNKLFRNTFSCPLEYILFPIFGLNIFYISLTNRLIVFTIGF